eukprot:Opistho-1_new@50641
MSSKFVRLPPDHLILERRRQEDLRGAMADQTRYFHKTLLQSHWEKETDRRIAHNHVTAKLQRARISADEALDRRRDALRELLDRERDEYIGELSSISTESDGDRRDRMRKRAEELREARERERQIVADEKKMQQFRNDCVELRTVHSKQLEESIIAERGAQLEDRQRQRQAELQEEARYAEMWEKDRLLKVEREERDAARRAQLNAEASEADGGGACAGPQDIGGDARQEPGQHGGAPGGEEAPSRGSRKVPPTHRRYARNGAPAREGARRPPRARVGARVGAPHGAPRARTLCAGKAHGRCAQDAPRTD